jgi:hypothetical protein
VSLLGEPIDPAKIWTPEEWALPWAQRPANKFYAPGSTHFRRDLAYEDHDVYDGVLYYMCPDCDGAWHFWTKADGARYRAAQEAVDHHNRHRRTTQ